MLSFPFSQTRRHRSLPRRSRPLLLLIFAILSATPSFAQSQAREDEIIANLAGGRVIVHVAKDVIIFAAIDKPVERNSISPRVMNVDSGHLGILFGAAEWRIPADPKPIRMDRDLPHIGARDPHYQPAPGEAEPDLETIGVAFLEKLRPLVAQLHHKLDFASDDPIFQLVIIGYGADNYGPEVWVVEYRMEQEMIASRGEYWQTRVLRPRFTQLYPPEKHAPRTIVESRYPPDSKGPTLGGTHSGQRPAHHQSSRRKSALHQGHRKYPWRHCAESRCSGLSGFHARGLARDRGQHSVYPRHHERATRFRMDRAPCRAAGKGRGRQESPARCAHPAAAAQTLIVRRFFRLRRRAGWSRPRSLGTAFRAVPRALFAVPAGSSPSGRKACRPR